MDFTRIVSFLVLIAFSVLTVYSMWVSEQSCIDFGLHLVSSIDTAQVVIDLYIMAFLASVWMVYDNRLRGRSFVKIIPYIGITLVFVSIGPLLYLVVNGFISSKRQKS